MTTANNNNLRKLREFLIVIVTSEYCTGKFDFINSDWGGVASGIGGRDSQPSEITRDRLNSLLTMPDTICFF